MRNQERGKEGGLRRVTKCENQPYFEIYWTVNIKIVAQTVPHFLAKYVTQRRRLEAKNTYKTIVDPL